MERVLTTLGFLRWLLLQLQAKGACRVVKEGENGHSRRLPWRLLRPRVKDLCREIELLWETHLTTPLPCRRLPRRRAVAITNHPKSLEQFPREECTHPLRSMQGCRISNLFTEAVLVWEIGPHTRQVTKIRHIPRLPQTIPEAKHLRPAACTGHKRRFLTRLR